MKDFIDIIKNYFAFLFRKSKTSDDRMVKRYDLMLFVGATFLIIYTCFFLLNLQYTAYESTPSVVDIGMTETELLHPRLANTPTIGYATVTLPDITMLKTNQFYVGEIVGVRYFGIYGIVREKIISTSGYKYQVRWRDGHSLPTDEFFAWELFRPEKGSVPVSVLIP